MRKFDPWPVFFRREWNRNWPFLVGFAITGTLITKFSLSLTEEDAKNSPFVQRHKSHFMECLVNQKSKRKGKGGRKHIRGLNLQFKQNSFITIMEKKMKGKGNHRSYHSQEIRGH
ncbi:hypothetical protein NC653_026096 [Populus alba x Populus x berolinensis]|uniref:Uncharacterized protein n=1 Tax=Populus alba x Populus x berolinensis TaxID=444605 RepID=A0AAD6Q9U9_9ROSI|nr:hypothetical protein NC653_026096 [Populus alba x Populus x berolinensis]